jgi:hypothetical protein
MDSNPRVTGIVVSIYFLQVWWCCVVVVYDFSWRFHHGLNFFYKDIPKNIAIKFDEVYDDDKMEKHWSKFNEI